MRVDSHLSLRHAEHRGAEVFMGNRQYVVSGFGRTEVCGAPMIEVGRASTDSHGRFPAPVVRQAAVWRRATATCLYDTPRHRGTEDFLRSRQYVVSGFGRTEVCGAPDDRGREGEH